MTGGWRRRQGRPRGAAWLAAFFGAALVAWVLLSLNLVQVTVDGRVVRRLLLPCGTPGDLRFHNSVTGSPVSITFQVCRGLRRFRMETDAAGVEYYTAGFYDLEDVLADRVQPAIHLCSEVGIQVSLGSFRHRVAGECMGVRVLWPLPAW